jgi:hypothetical protein
MKNNKRIIVDAEGFGIDYKAYELSKKKDDPSSRRIEIYLDILRPEEIAYHKRLAGGELQWNKDKTNPVPLTSDQSNLFKEKKIENNPMSVNEQKNVDPSKQEKILKVEDNHLNLTEVKMNDSTKNNIPSIEQTSEPDTSQKQGNTVSQMTNKDITTDKSMKLDKANVDINTDKQTETKETPKNEQNSCYSIRFNTYESESEALAAKKTLEDNAVDNVKVLPFIDQFGSTSYRLLTGCYTTPNAAFTALKELGWTTKLLNLKRRPDVIKERNVILNNEKKVK